MIVAAVAEAQEKPRKQTPVVRALDIDQDGTISAAEIQNAPAALRSLDQNGDGRISLDEWRAAPDPRIKDSEQVVQWIMAFDADHDGRISAAELPERLKGMIARADSDKDGFLSPEEIRVRAFADADVPADPKPDLVTAALDTDHDGVISADEIAHASMALMTLDRNSDGQITEDETRPLPKPAAPPAATKPNPQDSK
jgi:Ca2+-binding EF-hand superfamily protein